MQDFSHHFEEIRRCKGINTTVDDVTHKSLRLLHIMQYLEMISQVVYIVQVHVNMNVRLLRREGRGREEVALMAALLSSTLFTQVNLLALAEKWS